MWPCGFELGRNCPRHLVLSVPCQRHFECDLFTGIVEKYKSLCINSMSSSSDVELQPHISFHAPQLLMKNMGTSLAHAE